MEIFLYQNMWISLLGLIFPTLRWNIAFALFVGTFIILFVTLYLMYKISQYFS